MKNYIAIVRDHSGSMGSLRDKAIADYNGLVKSLQQAATQHAIDTIVTVVECGFGNTNQSRTVISNSTVQSLKPATRSDFTTSGHGTPLWDAVGQAIEALSGVPDRDRADVSFLVMVITDGHENASVLYSAPRLSNKIRELQNTDRWTFTFRTPRNYGNKLASALGINPGNILEWDQTEKGLHTASETTSRGIESYYTARSKGETSTGKFYSDLSNVSTKEVKQVAQEITSKVRVFQVNSRESIKPFVERVTNQSLRTGTAFYQLTKPEKEVQDHKKVIIRDRTTRRYYSGSGARQLLGLPAYGTVQVVPGNHGNFDIFIQSTSVNRALMPGTDLIIYE